ncbi:MAG: hypothetical protein ACKO1J_13670 [Tagaea sp.]
MIVMLDSMIYDKIIENDGFLDVLKRRHSQGTLRIIDTHIQLDQLSATTDECKRTRLLALIEELKLLAVRVPTIGGVWDVTRWDEGTFGSDEENIAIEKAMNSNPRHSQDALIAVTAAAHVDYLITEDRPLTNRISSSGLSLKVLTFEGFTKALGSY